MHDGDISSLEAPTEENTLEALRKHYSSRQIYMQCDIILISINPLTKVNIYGASAMKAYLRNHGHVEPHIYSLAESAMQKLAINGNQTIIVSGESGSGKTVNSEHLLRYITWRSGGREKLENILLSSHFILECFGNARTKINDNSSRFGKFLTLHFSGEKIVGGTIAGYLLEKSRVTHQAAGNSNFHIFYLVCAAEGLDITNDYIKYEHSTSDLHKYVALDTKFRELELGDFDHIRRILLAVIRIGSVCFVDNDGVLGLHRDENLNLVCATLGMTVEYFEKALVEGSFSCNKERVVTLNTRERARVVRDTFARNIYARVFHHVIALLNRQMECSESEKTVSLLDIYGFEVFDKNDFDQLCVNWANERIQNEFVRRMSMDRQRFYESEGIEWPNIDFPTNDAVLRLLEKKCGLADLIEEESLIPCGSTASLLVKMHKHNRDEPHFLPTNSKNTIKIDHFACPVEYAVDNFLDKNTEDGLSQPHVDLGLGSDMPTDRRRSSVIRYFKESMHTLFSTINKTEIHYVRCIRPNKTSTPWEFDVGHVAKQIKSCGVVETVRLSQLTYPHVISKETFESRYAHIQVPGKGAASYKVGMNFYFVKNDFLNWLERDRDELLASSKAKIERCIHACVLQSTLAHLREMAANAHAKEEIAKMTSVVSEQRPFASTEETSTDIIEMVGQPTAQDANNDPESGDAGDKVAGNGFLVFENTGLVSNDSPGDAVETPRPTCQNCKNMDVKYRYQCEMLKKKKDVESELESMHSVVRKYETDIASYRELIKDMTISANQVLLEYRSLKQEAKKTPYVNFSNPHDILACLIDVYLEYSPLFTTKSIPKDEMLSFAHLAYKIVLELAAREQCSELFYLEMLVYEVTEKIPLFDQNVHKVAFMVSNLVELKVLMRTLEAGASLGELDMLIRAMFEHFCELQKSTVSALLPDSVIYYQAIDSFRCEDSFYKRFFNKTPSVLKLVSHLEYFCSMMTYFGFPDTFVREALRFLLQNINSVCFNRILVEKNFLSFNRSTQINFNLNEVQKFCQEVGFVEGIAELGHLQDVIKLVNLAKNNNGLDVIQQECTSLNTAQLNTVVSKLKSFAVKFSLPDMTDDLYLFVAEPRVTTPDPGEGTKFVFCAPRFIPADYVSTIVSSV